MPQIDRLSKIVVDASMELYRRRSWRGIDPDAPFSIRLPTEEEPLAGVLAGPAGGDFGLFLSLGPDALGRLLRQRTDEEAGGEHFERCDHLVVIYTRLGEVREELRAILTAAGFRTRKERVAPCIFSKPAGKQPRTPNKRELKALAWCLAAVLGAEDLGELKPVLAERGEPHLELQVRGRLAAPDVEARWVPLEWDELGGLASPVLLPDELRERPRLAERWCLGVSPVPGGIQGDDRMFHSVVVLNEETEKVLSVELVPGGSARYVVDPLVDAVEELGLPTAIVFNRETLFDALAPALTGLEVQCSLEPDHPLLEEAMEDLERFLRDEVADDERASPAGPPTSLEDWKALDLEFGYRTSDDLGQQDLITPRAMKAYFGSEELALRVIDELEQLGPLGAFIEWLAADYRPNKRTKPYFDRRLEEPDLGDVERALIESRRGALLSFFEVVSVEPGASLELEDLLDRRRYTVYDSALSSCDVEGYVLPLRLFKLDRWYVPSVAGPPIPIQENVDAAEMVQRIAAQAEPAGLRASAETLGALWVSVMESDGGPSDIEGFDLDSFG